MGTSKKHGVGLDKGNTFTPVLVAWLLPQGLAAGRHCWLKGLNSGRMGRSLAWALDRSLRNPVAAIALALALALGLPVTGFLSLDTLTA